MRADVDKAVELLQSGDAARVEHALQLLQNTVFSFSMNVCGHREDAEDTMQEVLVKAIPYLPKFDSPKALTTWLYTVAKNRCLMSRRKSKFAPKQHLSLEELMPDAPELERLSAVAAKMPTPETLALATQNADLLKDAIRQLPPQYRLILVLHDMEELSTEEISRITGLREGTIRVRLHRARLFVRKELAKMAAQPGTRKRAQAPAHPPRPGKCKEMFASLSDYLDGLAGEDLCDELQKHMSGCKPCQAFLASLQAAVKQIKSTEGVTPNPETAIRMRQRLVTQLEKALAAAK